MGFLQPFQDKIACENKYSKDKKAQIKKSKQKYINTHQYDAKMG